MFDPSLNDSDALHGEVRIARHEIAACRLFGTLDRYIFFLKFRLDLKRNEEVRVVNEKMAPGKRVPARATAIITAVVLLFSVFACGQAMPGGNETDVQSNLDLLYVLLLIQADVQGHLSDLNVEVANASSELSKTGLSGAAAREVLSKKMKNSSIVQGALIYSTFGKNGEILETECRGCSGSAGEKPSSNGSEKNLSGTPDAMMKYVILSKNPAISREFKTTFGFNGSILAYPVFSKQDELLGGVSATFEPDVILNALSAPEQHLISSSIANITGFSIFVLDLDGRIAYDDNPAEIGKNVFGDPFYEPFQSLIELAHKIVAERAGHGRYSFQDNGTAVQKECYWTTAGIHGGEFRIVATRIAQR
jgi:polar amino acid transport system substrate-binding protein